MIKIITFIQCFLLFQMAWGQISEQKLIASDSGPGDFFGRYIAIYEDVLFVGAHQDDVNGYASGSLYIFSEKEGIEGFEEIQKIVPEDGDIEEFFGYSIDIEKNWAITGSHHDSDFGGSSGSAFILKQNEQGTWEIVQKVLPNDPKAGDEFAKAVGMKNNCAFTGAFLDDDKATNAGSVYVFRLMDGEWVQSQEIYATDAEAHDQFGNFLSASNYALAIGVPEKISSGEKSGCVYVFEENDHQWQQTQKIFPSDLQQGDQFGQSLSLSNNFLSIGAYKADALHEDGGAVYVYKKENEEWILNQKIIPEDNEMGDHFGNAVDQNEELLVIGAYFDDDLGSKSGSIYVYKLEADTFKYLSKITASDGSAGDAFGSSLRIEGQRIVTGAYADSDHGFFAGSVYVLDIGELLTAPVTFKNKNVVVYPTIVKSLLNVEIKEEIQNPIIITVYDNTGMRVFSKKIELHRESIYLGMLPPGIYHVILSSGKNEYHTSIVKE